MEQAHDTKSGTAAQADSAAHAVLTFNDVEHNALHFILGYIAGPDGAGLIGSRGRIRHGLESARVACKLTDDQTRRVASTFNVRWPGGAK
jgi:hypothetical protein